MGRLCRPGLANGGGRFRRVSGLGRELAGLDRVGQLGHRFVEEVQERLGVETDPEDIVHYKIRIVQPLYTSVLNIFVGRLANQVSCKK